MDVFELTRLYLLSRSGLFWNSSQYLQGIVSEVTTAAGRRDESMGDLNFARCTCEGPLQQEKYDVPKRRGSIHSSPSDTAVPTYPSFSLSRELLQHHASSEFASSSLVTLRRQAAELPCRRAVSASATASDQRPQDKRKQMLKVAHSHIRHQPRPRGDKGNMITHTTRQHKIFDTKAPHGAPAMLRVGQGSTWTRKKVVAVRFDIELQSNAKSLRRT